MLTEAGLPISDEAVRNWMKSGRIASRRFPSGRLFVPREAVEAVISGEPVEAGAA